MEKFTCKLSMDMTWPAKLHTQNGLILDFSKPPEYRGILNTMTPEDAFVSAVITCLACTFDSIVNKMRLKVTRYESDGTGIVDRVDSIEKFTELTVNVRIVIPPETNKESIQKAIEKAQKNCLVANSLNILVKYNVNIESG